MKKWILSILILMITCQVRAAKTHLACQGSSGSSLVDTGYILAEEDDHYELKVKYLEGRIPLDSDPLTTTRSGDIPLLQKRSQVFNRLPLEFQLIFKKPDCHFDKKNGEISWACYIRQPGQLGKLKYKNLAFFVYSQKVTSPYSTYRLYNVGLEFGLSAKEDYEGSAGLQNITYNRGAVVAFENSQSQTSCHVPNHETK